MSVRFHHPRRAVLTSLLLAVTCSGALIAEPPWIGEPFSADPVRVMEAARAVTILERADVAVLFTETTYRLDAHGRRDLRRRLVYRILSQAGLDGWATVSSPWSPWHEERPRLRARVIDAGGVVRVLDPSTVSDRPIEASADDLFHDRRVLEAPLPGLSIGVVVEEEVSVRDREPFFAPGVVGGHSLAMWAPIYRGRVVLEAPEGLPLRYALHNLDGVEARELREAGQLRVVVDYQEMPSYRGAVPGLPPDEPHYPSFHYATGESWSAIARAYSEIVDRRIGDSALSELRERVPRPSSEDPSRRIQELLDWVRREVRYTGLELGSAGLVPYPPDQVVQRRFGDCKDQATLLTALLRAEGISAYVALLHAGDGPDVDEGLPGLGHFDHSVVYVPEPRPLWIDPTASYTRAGELPIADQGRLALVASPTSRRLMRTPATSSAENRVVEHRRVVMADRGPGKIVETTEYFGGFEQQVRSAYAGIGVAAVRAQFAGYVEETYLADRLVSVEFTPPEDLTRPFRFEVVAAGAERVLTDMSEAAVAIFPSILAESLPDPLLQETGAERLRPYAFPQPFQVEYRYRVEAPSGFELRWLPESEHKRYGGGAVEMRFAEAADGAVEATLRLDTGPRVIEAVAFEAFRRGALELLRREPVVLHFDHLGESRLAAGEVAAAIAVNLELVAREPRNVMHQVRLARSYMGGGMQRAALRAAREAVALAPDSASANWILGWVLTHDEMGRRFGDGFDYDGALAALRRATACDPQDELALGELAILLDHNRRGLQFGEGADLTAAVAAHRLFRETFDTQSHDVNLMQGLLHLGRFAELEELTETLAPSTPRNQHRLVALAVHRGTQQALREVARLSADAQERVQLLAAAAQQLVALRRYSLAAELLNHTVRHVTSPSLLVYTRMVEGAAAAPLASGPEGVVRRLIEALLREESDPRSVERLFLPESVEAAGVEWIADRIRRSLEPRLPSAVAGPSIPRRVLAELLAGSLAYAVEGDDERGYRVLASSAVGTDGSLLTAIVVPFGDGYRLVATGSTRGLIGASVLRLVGAGEHRRARQWLHWASADAASTEWRDPLLGPLLPGFRSAGDRAERGMTAAGAVMMAEGGLASAALPILEGLLAGGEGGGERQRLRRALLLAHLELDHQAEVLTLARELLEESDSPFAFVSASEAMMRMGLLTQARRLAEERLGHRPGDSPALRALAALSQLEGNTEESFSFFSKLHALGKADPVAYNEWAWLHLFQSPVSEEAVRLAEWGAQLSSYQAYPLMHTLACAYAAADRPEAAYRTLRQAVGLQAPPGPRPGDWYVLGRIAESYGLLEDAQAYYRRLAPPSKGEPFSTSQLASRRLRRLQGAASGGPRPVAQAPLPPSSRARASGL